MTKKAVSSPSDYLKLSDGICRLLEHARQKAAQSVNTILTATYWEVGRRIVEHEQQGKDRAGYGEGLLQRLSADLTPRLGRGFSADNLERMRLLYLYWPPSRISASLARKSKTERASRKSAAVPRKLSFEETAAALKLSWTHYALLIRVENPHGRHFYEEEALRGGWSTRQLERQIGSQFYERTALSRDKATMLVKGARSKPGELLTPEEQIKDPYVLEFLGLKDEYSESELEDALIHHLESFLLELGSDFTFVARQKRLRVGSEWYRVDLVFYHRRLRCLVLIDLKLDRLTHADAGQMHLYLNYAREHWTHADENPPVGLILCARKDHAVAHYALEGLPSKVLASEYRTTLPDERKLADEIQRTRLTLDTHVVAGRSRKPKRV